VFVENLLLFWNLLELLFGRPSWLYFQISKSVRRKEILRENVTFILNEKKTFRDEKGNALNPQQM
jgi:hypothetical protein